VRKTLLGISNRYSDAGWVNRNSHYSHCPRLTTIFRTTPDGLCPVPGGDASLPRALREIAKRDCFWEVEDLRRPSVALHDWAYVLDPVSVVWEQMFPEDFTGGKRKRGELEDANVAKKVRNLALGTNGSLLPQRLTTSASLTIRDY